MNRIWEKGHKQRTTREVRETRDVSNYVPRWVLDHVRKGKGIEEHISTVHGAAMYCDIVGFTSLTESLSSGGASQGAELISVVLNTFFDKLLLTIKSFGGDVIQFSGDAILSVFTNPSSSKSCVECAVAMCKEAATVSLSIGKLHITPSLRTGVGKGKIHRVLFGSKRSQWHSVVCGEACSHAWSCCEKADPNQLYIHPHFASDLSSFAFDIQCGLVSPPFPSPVVPVPTSPSFSPASPTPSYLSITPPPTHPTIVTPTSQSSDSSSSFPASPTHSPTPDPLQRLVFKVALKQSRSEVRSVVVMFMSFKGFETPESLAILGSALERSVSKFGGVFNKLMVDDKGIVALVCFGLPFYTHSDNCERACHCAMEVIRKFDTQVVAGICKDKVYCGEVGNSFRAEYTVLGDAVNVSSRLMTYGETASNGESTIVVDEVVANESPRIHIRQREMISVKGKTDLIFAGTVDLSTGNSSGSEDDLAINPSILRSVPSIKSVVSSGSLGSRTSRSSRTSRAWKKMRSSFKFINEVKSVTESYVSIGVSNTLVVGRETAKRSLKEFVRNLFFSSAVVPGMSGTLPSMHLFVVKGGRGMGKTTLLSYFCECLQKDKIAHIKLLPRQTMSDIPNYGVIHVTKRISNEVGDKDWMVQLITTSDFSRVVKKALLAPSPDEAYLIPPEVVEKIIIMVVTAYAHKTNNSIVVIVVDDIDAMDDVTVKALLASLQAFNTNEGIMMGLVCSHVEEYKPFAIAQQNDGLMKSVSLTLSEDDNNGTLKILHSMNPLVAVLNRFTHDECVNLCKACLNADSIEDILLDLVKRYCDGCPMIITQALDSLLAEGIIAVNGDLSAEVLQTDADFDKILSSMSTIESVAIGTLDKLKAEVSPLSLEIMKIGCVVGKPFEFRLISAILNVTNNAHSDEVENTIRLLERRNVFHKCDDERFHTFTLHALSLTLYSNMLSSEKCENHFRIGQAMEDLWHELDHITPADVARHYEYGGYPTGAARWSVKAGTYLTTKGEYKTAERYIQKAIMFETQSEDAGLEGLRLDDIRWQLTQLYVLLGSFTKSVKQAAHLLGLSELGIVSDAIMERDVRRRSRRMLGFTCCFGSSNDKYYALESNECIKGYHSIVDMGIITNQLALIFKGGGRLIQDVKRSRSKPDLKAIDNVLRLVEGVKVVLDYNDVVACPSLPSLLLLLHLGLDSETMRDFVRSPLEFVGLRRGNERARMMAPAYAATVCILMGNEAGTAAVLRKNSEVLRKQGCEHGHLTCLALYYMREVVFESENDERVLGEPPQELMDRTNKDDTLLEFICCVGRATSVSNHEAIACIDKIIEIQHEMWFTPVALPALIHFVWVVILLQHKGDIMSSWALDILQNYVTPHLKALSFNKHMGPVLQLTKAAIRFINRKDVNPSSLSSQGTMPLVTHYILSAICLWYPTSANQYTCSTHARQYSFRITSYDD